MDHRFQVHLSGLIELLSHHLYSGPAVFIRELLQNGVDAIRARQGIEPTHAGRIQIELFDEREPATLLFQDNGVGLTEEEVHRFLATIGESSKRGEDLIRPTDYLGQFGIGLLSCFMVCDEVVLISRSAKPGDHSPVEWRGRTDGTYSVRVLEQSVPVGTQIFLRAKPSAAEFFQAQRLVSMCQHYGCFLEPEISLVAEGGSQRISVEPPWQEELHSSVGLQRAIGYARETFEQDFFDAILLKSRSGQVEGVGFVMAHPVHAGTRQSHRVYLKRMLLSTGAENLLPEWGFFVRCVLNANALTPTASRESFYEDRALALTRAELGDCLRSYLINLARTDPRRLNHFLDIHHLAIKALAVEDDQCLEVFANWLPFETSLGTMPFGEFHRENPVIRYVPTRDQFRQIAQVAASESLAVVNAGYVYDVQLLERLGTLRDDVQVEPFDVEQLSDRFIPLSLEEREGVIEFERLADTVLSAYKCAAEVTKFRPKELPALYVTNESADFLRSVEQSQEVANDLWSGVLESLSPQEHASAYSRLHFNYLNPLIQRVAQLTDREAQQRCVETLYVQSLLLGHFPLRAREIRVLTEGLQGLIEWALRDHR